MTDRNTPERPVLWGQVGSPIPFSPNGRNGEKVDLPSPSRQEARLKDRFTDLDNAFNEQAQLTDSLGANDPQLVIVFEAIDENEDLSKVASRAGLEILSEVGCDFAPDEDFPRKSTDQEAPVAGCLHAVCANETAKAQIISQWRKWHSTGVVDRGYASLKHLFAHLKEVRAWGPQDRVRSADIASVLEGMLPGDHSVEIELWYRQSPEARSRAENEVSALITQGGGRVLSTAQVAESGYHGLKCVVPLEVLQKLASGDYDAVTVVKSAHVMYFRVTVQSHLISEESPTKTHESIPFPTGDPVLCVLDGVPVANHPLLAHRVSVYDPDDLASTTISTPNLRQHGTAMASVCVWGDRSLNEPPAQRPVLLRPILIPSTETVDNSEELPDTVLAPDLMHRIFRELFDGNAQIPPAAPSVAIINLSVGDPAAPFDGVISSWARTLDWLSAKYGVLVIVSAGNHPVLPVPGGTRALLALTGEERAKVVNAGVAHTTPRRSLLAPADSINALTVGAINTDGTGNMPVSSYHFDPSDGTFIVSPTSALGAGHHRSVKPDLVAPGGQTRFQIPMVGNATEARPAMQGTLGPGIKVAATQGGEAFTVGTSPAAALVSREAAQAADAVIELADRDLTRSELAVATKAFLAHTASVPDTLIVDENLKHFAHGYGVLARHLTDGCAPHEAAILYVGDIGENESRILSFPIPNGLQSRGVKHVSATLAWLSPINWRHRQYRRAALSFAQPVGLTALGTALGPGGDNPKRGTLQHVEWKVTKSIGVGQGNDLNLTVNCKGQAGGLQGERVAFAVVLSLWVAPELNVDVYSQVQQEISARVGVRATPGIS